MPEGFPSQQIGSFNAILGFNNLDESILLMQDVLSQSNFLCLLWAENILHRTFGVPFQNS